MAYLFQTFSVKQVLTAAQMNQVEVNVRDHFHGKNSIQKTGISWVRTAKTGTFTAVAADIGALFDITSGTFTIDFSGAATLGAGWSCAIDNNGDGIITLDPNSTETIDGDTTLRVVAGSGIVVYSDGSNLHTLALGGSRKLILTQIIGTPVAEVDFDNKLTSAFNQYELSIKNLGVDTDNAQIRIQIGTGAGPTYQAGTSYKQNGEQFQAATFTPVDYGSTAAGARFSLTGASTDQGVDSGDTKAGLSGEFVIFDPASAVHAKRALWRSSWGSGVGNSIAWGMGQWDDATAVTSLRVTSSGTNLDEGELSLYGIVS